MKAKDITVGGTYRAKVNGRLTAVRVLAIDQNGSGQTRYRVRDEATSRETVFRSPASSAAWPAPTPNPGVIRLTPKAVAEIGVKYAPEALRRCGRAELPRMQGLRGHRHPARERGSGLPLPRLTDGDILHTALTNVPVSPGMSRCPHRPATRPLPADGGARNRPPYPARPAGAAGCASGLRWPFRPHSACRRTGPCAPRSSLRPAGLRSGSR